MFRLTSCLAVLVVLIGSGEVNADMGGPIVITEIGIDALDYLEIGNVSGQTVDTSDWFVTLNWGQVGDITDARGKWYLPPSMEPLGWNDPWPCLHDRDGFDEWPWLAETYYGGPIFWRTQGPGWAMIVDDEGEIADFVVWRYSPDDVASLDQIHLTNFDGTEEILTFDQSAWSGPSVPLESESANVDRFMVRNPPVWDNGDLLGSADHDDASDWFYWSDPDWGFAAWASPGEMNDWPFQIPFVPEPSTLVLLFMGTIGLLAYGWRRRR